MNVERERCSKQPQFGSWFSAASASLFLHGIAFSLVWGLESLDESPPRESFGFPTAWLELPALEIQNELSETEVEPPENTFVARDGMASDVVPETPVSDILTSDSVDFDSAEYDSNGPASASGAGTPGGSFGVSERAGVTAASSAITSAEQSTTEEASLLTPVGPVLPSSLNETGVRSGNRADAPRDIELDPGAVLNRLAAEQLHAERARSEGIEQEVQQGLVAAARRRAYLSDRPPPRLERDVDGGYRFRGHVFRARIAPNGEVEFQNEYAEGAGYETVTYETENGTASVPGVGGSFDITDAIERRLGNDPYAAERRWFLEETRELRDELASAYREQSRRRALVRLRRELYDRIDAAESDADFAALRAHVVSRWNGADGDGAERVHDAIIELLEDALPRNEDFDSMRHRFVAPAPPNLRALDFSQGNSMN